MTPRDVLKDMILKLAEKRRERVPPPYSVILQLRELLPFVDDSISMGEVAELKTVEKL